ncbi:MAG: NAD-dependent epimerase/dehydratase family protein [Gammaproteobacteria bacterium]|nr:NAD-dependent epimerase/dehydratase family protein [Gammaproteobacteria bacterium]
MKVIVTGGDGFCGWPTSLHLSNAGHEVLIIDNLSRRSISQTLRYESLTELHSIRRRIEKWHELTGKRIQFRKIDIAYEFESLAQTVAAFDPDSIVHLAAQRSAPYSMMSVESGNYTLSNNILSANNVLRAIEQHNRDIKLVHLGSIGVYGYEDRAFEIPEGKSEYTAVDSNNESYTVQGQIPFNPTSLYHLSKSQITGLLNYYTQCFGLNITDLYQGIVWGTQTAETNSCKELSNRFDYDEIYGTVLNRFVVQAQLGLPISVYGKGQQTRAFIHIQDTVKCIETAVNNGASQKNEVEVIHQISETRTVKSVADHVSRLLNGTINHIVNPREELEEHRYRLASKKFKELGMDNLSTLADDLLDEIQSVASKNLHRIDTTCIAPKVNWGKVARSSTRKTMANVA